MVAGEDSDEAVREPALFAGEKSDWIGRSRAARERGERLERSREIGRCYGWKENKNRDRKEKKR